ncbi:Hypothetical predicted protein [Marmota monax]|uniref:Uncharacterized protein n=1 Tax=Marmota monax TaxID=9995 RepID=A0A5E4CZY8_MARMO|nr:Hypothetical predicted protein [Marmota monax]
MGADPPGTTKTVVSHFSFEVVSLPTLLSLYPVLSSRVRFTPYDWTYLGTPPSGPSGSDAHTGPTHSESTFGPPSRLSPKGKFYKGKCNTVFYYTKT